APVRRILILGAVAEGACWKFTAGVVVGVTGKGELFEIVGAFDSTCSLTNFLHGGKEEANQDSNNCNDHQELDQSEGMPAIVPNPAAPNRRKWTHGENLYQQPMMSC